MCSSENAADGKGQTHREVMYTVAEMKKRLPSDKRSRSKASTVEALHYALNCVKQVQGNLAPNSFLVIAAPLFHHLPNVSKSCF